MDPKELEGEEEELEEEEEEIEELEGISDVEWVATTWGFEYEDYEECEDDEECEDP